VESVTCVPSICPIFSSFSLKHLDFTLNGERTVTIDFGLLGRIHGLLKQQTDFNERLQRGPKRIQLIQKNEANFLKAWEDAKDLVRKTQMAADQKQLHLGEREAKMKDLQFKLNTCETNKEFQLLKERIAADEQANSVLQDEIFELLERLDRLHEDVQQAKNNYEKAQAEAIKGTEAIKREIKSLELDLASVIEDLSMAEKQLSGDIQSEYRRRVKSMQENVLGQTDGENCGNCFQRLTIQMTANIKMKRAVYCQGCGCLLYANSG